MSEKIICSVISAVIGGVVGAMVVFFLSGKTKFDQLEVGFLSGKTKFDQLEVGNLTITKQAALLNDEGKEDVVLKDGSVLANQVVLGKKFIGQQYQGHIFVGNRMFTSPDDLVATPMDQWRFYTELGASTQMGGELIVRSPNGANIVGQPVADGMLFRAGYDENGGLQLFARANDNGAMAFVPFGRPSVPGPQSSPYADVASTTETAATDKPAQSETSIATAPDAGAVQ